MSSIGAGNSRFAGDNWYRPARYYDKTWRLVRCEAPSSRKARCAESNAHCSDCRDGAESRPDDQVAGGEERCRSQCLCARSGDTKDRWRRARDHHRDHHDRPHRKNDRLRSRRSTMAAASASPCRRPYPSSAFRRRREDRSTRPRRCSARAGEDGLQRPYSSWRRTQNARRGRLRRDPSARRSR